MDALLLTLILGLGGIAATIIAIIIGWRIAHHYANTNRCCVDPTAHLTDSAGNDERRQTAI